jgi:uncharacterized membrane protein
VGRVLGTGFAVWFRNLIPFLMITTLFHAPPWIWAVSVAHGEQTLETLRAAGQAFLIATALTIPLNVFVAAALTYGVVMELHGQRASIGACIATGLARFLPALAVGLLTWFLICLASLALVVPGVIVLCTLYVSTPVSVVERPGIGAALNRSVVLTAGRRWRIFGLFLLLFVANWLSFHVVGRLAVSAHPTTLEAVFDNISRLIYVSFAYHVILSSISAVLTSVVYFHLRTEKEGTSTTELAAIFD